MPFTFETTPLAGLTIISPRVFLDDRGYFMETYKSSEFIANGIAEAFVQANHSFSRRHVIRGLHYQRNPHAQAKLVRCVQGVIWDVAVDIRSDSPTFGRWHGVELSAEEMRLLYIPPGFAHGFATLSECAHVSYNCSAEYNPQAEGSIIWNDAQLGIKWPVNEEDALLSIKDSESPGFGEILGRC